MSDTQFLLEVLSDGEPHSLNEILSRSFTERGCGLTVHSRAADLRKQGHVITNTAQPFTKSSSVYQLRSPAVRPDDFPAGERSGWADGNHSPHQGPALPEEVHAGPTQLRIGEAA